MQPNQEPESNAEGASASEKALEPKAETALAATPEPEKPKAEQAFRATHEPEKPKVERAGVAAREAEPKAKERRATVDDLAAFNLLARHERLGDMVSLVRAIATEAAAAGKADWKAPTRLKELALERKLDAKDAETELGSLLSVLEKGPASPREDVLLRALFAHAIAENRPKTTEDEDNLAHTALWLAVQTPFDATRLIDRALGEDAAELWAAIADRIAEADRGEEPGRAAGLVGAAALGASTNPGAMSHATRLAKELKDPALVRLLRSEPRAAEVASPRPTVIRGEVRMAPRGPLGTTLLALSGVLFFAHVVRLSARAALGFRRPAEVSISESGARIHSKTEILGRTLNERDVVLGREGLASVRREVKYPRAALYAGLFCLALGSFVGVRALADGVRAASPSLLLTGLVLVGLGVLFDFALGSLFPSAAGRCRLIFVPRAGPRVCVADVDSAEVDLALKRLASG
jgi:hypothetical protein